MAEIKKYIAVDLGAESGRVMVGSVSKEKLILEEIHRFGNGPIEENDSLRWDFNKLLSEIKIGIAKAAKAAGSQIWGIGVDSWGVDFGLLDVDGKLIENPYHYRDSQTNGMMEKAFKLMGKRDIYENTGIQFMQFNSLYQLRAMRLNNSIALATATKLIFIADLISYFLCGKIFAEYTLASTSQFMDMRTGKWSGEIMDKLSLPAGILPEIVPPGTVIGQLSSKIGVELGCGPVPIIAIGSHDTASAVVAVPACEDTKWAYLSSGTWSLMGVEVPGAIINDKTFQHEFTNEGGVDNTIRLLKNIMGLWLMQECKRQWQRKGTELSYTELAAMAKEAEPFTRYINVDDGRFLAPGDMPRRINKYLKDTGQEPVKSKGQMIRTILESLVMKYRSIMEAIEDASGDKFEILHIVGGGIQNELLCQFTANALGKKVITGPIEATASGNVLMQARATGQIESLQQAREIVRNSFELKEYEPQDVSRWDKQYNKVRK
ncbi:MAG: rhamnulokinase [Sedimentisphaerales bacterium]|nr:rhamnulokinase [Sedimentisphaerales bacterium]